MDLHLQGLGAISEPQAGMLSPSHQGHGHGQALSDFDTLNLDFALTSSHAPNEPAVSESVTQELDYFEKIVFSFDMEGDPNNTLGNPGQGGEAGGSGSGERAGGSSSRSPTPSIRPETRDYYDQIDPQLLNALYTSPRNSANVDRSSSSRSSSLPHLPPMSGTMPFDPYMIAHAAALSALAAVPQQQQPQTFPGQHGANPTSADPYAFIRAMYGQNQPFPPATAMSPPSLAHSGLSSSSGRNTSSVPQWHSDMTQPNTAHLSSPSTSQPQTLTVGGLNRFQIPPQPEAGPSQPRGRSQSLTTHRDQSQEPLDPDTLDDAVITEDKRRRNTAASARFRIKKKHRSVALDRTVTELEGRADILEKEAVELRRENGWLREMLVLKGRNMRAAREAASELSAGSGALEDDEEEEEELSEDTGKDKGKGKEGEK